MKAVLTSEDLWSVVDPKSTSEAKSVAKRARRTVNGKLTAESSAVYLKVTKSVWSECKAAGLNIKEPEMCETVLAGVPPVYDMILTVL